MNEAAFVSVVALAAINVWVTYRYARRVDMSGQLRGTVANLREELADARRDASVAVERARRLERIRAIQDDEIDQLITEIATLGPDSGLAVANRLRRLLQGTTDEDGTATVSGTLPDRSGADADDDD